MGESRKCEETTANLPHGFSSFLMSWRNHWLIPLDVVTNFPSLADRDIGLWFKVLAVDQPRDGANNAVRQGT